MEFHQFKNLSALSGVVHGCFPREAHGRSLNVAFEFGKKEALENRERLAEELRLDRIVGGKQDHGIDWTLFNESTALPSPDYEPTGVDALVTTLPGLGVMAKTADCQPILMAGLTSNGTRVAAVVHSGWRGSLKNIIGHIVTGLHHKLGVDPGSLVVGVGPSLGPCCAEFKNAEEDFPEWALKYRIGKSHLFDFWAMTRDQFAAMGVPDEAIELCGICTVCQRDRWFSFRGDSAHKGDAGRFGSVIGVLNFQ